MDQIDKVADSAAIQALIPELRLAARDLVNGSAISSDVLVQEALMVALRSWPQLPPAGELKPWLLGVLLAIAGLGYVVDSFAAVLYGESWTDVSNFTFLGEFLLALWLVIFGRRLRVDRPRRRDEGSRSADSHGMTGPGDRSTTERPS